jgi:hypothetical protein
MAFIGPKQPEQVVSLQTKTKDSHIQKMAAIGPKQPQ